MPQIRAATDFGKRCWRTCERPTMEQQQSVAFLPNDKRLRAVLLCNWTAIFRLHQSRFQRLARLSPTAGLVIGNCISTATSVLHFGVEYQTFVYEIHVYHAKRCNGQALPFARGSRCTARVTYGRNCFSHTQSLLARTSVRYPRYNSVPRAFSSVG